METVGPPPDRDGCAKVAGGSSAGNLVERDGADPVGVSAPSRRPPQRVPELRSSESWFVRRRLDMARRSHADVTDPVTTILNFAVFFGTALTRGSG
jgi:hypothetical protein